MRPEVTEWVRGIVAEYRPQPVVLEVGSRNINGSVRPLFPKPYKGLDMEPGPGVDVVDDILTVEGLEGFNTVVCCETLEHITEPWTAIERMYAALDPGGLVILTTVFSFPIHECPEDFWRFTPDGLRYLLERAGFYEIRIDSQGEGPVGVFAVGRKP